MFPQRENVCGLKLQTKHCTLIFLFQVNVPTAISTALTIIRNIVPGPITEAPNKNAWKIPKFQTYLVEHHILSKI